MPPPTALPARLLWPPKPNWVTQSTYRESDKRWFVMTRYAQSDGALYRARVYTFVEATQ